MLATLTTVLLETLVETHSDRIVLGGTAIVGVDDNFFELGGHSLLVNQIVSQMRKTFNVELSLRGSFETPTISALAASAREIRDGGADRVSPAVRDPRKARTGRRS